MASYPTERELAALRVWSARAPRILELLPGFRSKWENLSDLSRKLLFKGRTSKPKIKKRALLPLFYQLILRYLHGLKIANFSLSIPVAILQFLFKLQELGQELILVRRASPLVALILSLPSNPHFLTSLIDQDEL